MAKLKKLPSLLVINGFKGVIDCYVYMGIPCARRWPRSPGHNRAQAVQAGWSPWVTASRIWQTLTPEVQDAFNRMAAGTNMTGRDIQVKSYITSKHIRSL